MKVEQPDSGADTTRHEIWQTYIVFEKDSYMRAIIRNAEIRQDKRTNWGGRQKRENEHERTND